MALVVRKRTAPLTESQALPGRLRKGGVLTFGVN